MADDSVLPFALPAVCRKNVTAAFEGGQLTSGGGVLRLAGCIFDRRDPGRVVHRLADIFHAVMLAIACGYEDANDFNHLRDDRGFKLAMGKLPAGHVGRCSRRTMSRWENAPTAREVARALAVMVDLYGQSYRPPAPETIRPAWPIRPPTQLEACLN